MIYIKKKLNNMAVEEAERTLIEELPLVPQKPDQVPDGGKILLFPRKRQENIFQRNQSLRRTESKRRVEFFPGSRSQVLSREILRQSGNFARVREVILGHCPERGVLVQKGLSGFAETIIEFDELIF
jgi:hypothetical protein